MTIRLPARACPRCAQVLDALDGHSAAPRPGDVTLCAYCGAVLVFAEGMALRLMTPAEFRAACAADHQFVHAVCAAHVAGQSLKAAQLLQSRN